MNNINNNRDYNSYRDDRNNKFKGVFYVTVSVVTLVVAIIGASFSYFIASASSEEDAVSVGSTGFSLEYVEDSNNIANFDLIPTPTNVALYAAIAQEFDKTDYDNYQNDPSTANKLALKNDKCRDDNGNAVCGTYRFTVTNPSEMNVQQTLNFRLVPSMNTFANLYIMVVDPELVNVNGTSRRDAGVVLDEYHLNDSNKTGNAYELTDLSVTLQPGKSKTYELIIYIKNLEDVKDDDGFLLESGDQTELDSNRTFSAAMVIYPDGEDSNQIFGVIGESSGKFGEDAG